MVLKIYTEEWYKIVSYLREAANLPTGPTQRWWQQVLEKLVEADGQTQFDPDELGKKEGSFRIAKICTVGGMGFRLKIYARTETDPDHYLVFDLGEDSVGECYGFVLGSVFHAFWAAWKPVRLERKISGPFNHFFVDSDTAKLFQLPPLKDLGLGWNSDNIARWLRHTAGEAEKFVAAQKRVVAEYCQPAESFDPDCLLPFWKRTKFGRFLDLLGVA